MNKAIYLCAATALALASCSNDETVEIAKSEGISFRAVTGLNARASEFTTADLETANSLYVTSFKTDGSIMYGESKYEKSNGVWSAGQFWGAESQLNFYLAYPELKKWQADFQLTKDVKTITGFEVNDDIAKQTDYVAAYVEAQKPNAANDATPATLQHVLSQIEVQAKNTNKNITYKISAVRFGQIFSKGNYTFPTTNEVNGTFADLSEAKVYEYTLDTPVTLPQDGTTTSLKDNAVGNAMLIPQTLEKWDGENNPTNTDNKQYISVKMELTMKGADKPYYNGWAAVGVEGTWAAGNKYVYTLDFSKGAGRVDPNGPGNEQAEKPNQPGESILGAEITFDVKVKDWTDGFTGNQGDVDLN